MTIIQNSVPLASVSPFSSFRNSLRCLQSAQQVVLARKTQSWFHYLRIHSNSLSSWITKVFANYGTKERESDKSSCIIEVANMSWGYRHESLTFTFKIIYDREFQFLCKYWYVRQETVFCLTLANVFFYGRCPGPLWNSTHLHYMWVVTS
jgi:hypothetical protein